LIAEDGHEGTQALRRDLLSVSTLDLNLLAV